MWVLTCFNSESMDFILTKSGSSHHKTLPVGPPQYLWCACQCQRSSVAGHIGLGWIWWEADLEEPWGTLISIGYPFAPMDISGLCLPRRSCPLFQYNSILRASRLQETLCLPLSTHTLDTFFLLILSHGSASPKLLLTFDLYLHSQTLAPFPAHQLATEGAAVAWSNGALWIRPPKQGSGGLFSCVSSRRSSRRVSPKHKKP